MELTVDVVALGGAGGILRSCTKRGIVTRASTVDEMLDNSCVCHGERCNPEAQSDAVDGREVDVSLAHQRVDETVENRHEHDDSDGVEVLHQIVRNAVTLHLAG